MLFAHLVDDGGSHSGGIKVTNNRARLDRLLHRSYFKELVQNFLFLHSRQILSSLVSHYFRGSSDKGGGQIPGFLRREYESPIISSPALVWRKKLL